MIRNTLTAILLSICMSQAAISQSVDELTFVFYNVENLFDLVDDSLTADEEFTPEGAKHWNSGRYYTKIDRIARTLSASGMYEMPGIIGLCEVENRSVINDLLDHRYFKIADYSILHRDSPDDRGIDVALLYSAEIFSPISIDWIGISFPFDTEGTTREILYTSGLIFGTDTLHIFINHWPSRWGGVEATRPYRAEVAKMLRMYIDSLNAVFRAPKILVAGDLNDNPTDRSVYDILFARDSCEGSGNCLINLMLADQKKQNYGSLKYKADWEVYDQIIVSSSLLDKSGVFVKDRDAHIFHAPFLITEDERYLGTKPFRTYAGPRYLDGYSDHLPVYLKLVK